MAVIHVERLGGFAGFGGKRAHIRSRGQIETSELSKDENKKLESLFLHHKVKEPPGAADAFRYQLTRISDAGAEVVVVQESDLPEKLARCVKDELI